MQREVYKWLQGLDLTYAIKNPQRDVSNGFIIAEILSRYHPDSVPLVSFDRGISKSSREGNWSLLNKIKSKLDLTLPRSLELATQRCELGAAEQLLTILFSILTKKPIQPPNYQPTSSSLPHFATPTASLRAKDPVLAAIVDDDLRRYRTFQSIEAGKAPKQSSTRLLPEVKPVKPAEKSPSVSIEIKEVQVKAFKLEDLQGVVAESC